MFARCCLSKVWSQAIGRVIRHIGDWGVILLCDVGFSSAVCAQLGQNQTRAISHDVIWLCDCVATKELAQQMAWSVLESRSKLRGYGKDSCDILQTIPEAKYSCNESCS